MAITTSMADTFKVELLQGAHCFNAAIVATVTCTSGTTAFTSVTGSMAGIAVGMVISGTSIPVGTQVAAVTSATTLTTSSASTGTISAAPITFTGDVFKMALIKATSANTYSNQTTNYSVMTGFTDELANTNGYTTGGSPLVNATPIPGGTSPGVQALVSFSVNPSWTTATFSTIGCMIYNTANRYANVTGRCAGVFDFGGTQTVTNGTFTVVMPNFSSASAILRIA